MKDELSFSTFDKKFATDFYSLNIKWIEEYFSIEEAD